jgi:hypothetical protein
MFKRLRRTIELAGLSAGAMYFFDPDLGRRRRSLVRDQVNHWMNQIGDAVDVGTRDLENRLQGFGAELKHLVAGHDSLDDVVLARVRTKLGRYSSHPRAIEVAVQGGNVSLSGPCLADEVDDVVSAVEAVDGVANVENHMSVHASAGNLSPLQGGQHPTGEPTEFMQDEWSPATRLVLGTIGGLGMLTCAMKRSFGSMLCGASGLLMVARAVKNEPLKGMMEEAAEQFGFAGESARSQRGGGRQQQQHRVSAGSNVPQGGTHRATIGSSAGQRHTMTEDELVDEASMESFPASDAPSY